MKRFIQSIIEFDITKNGENGLAKAASNELAEKDNALKKLKEYFEENHAERIKYPEYLEFHHYHMILLALGIVEKL